MKNTRKAILALFLAIALALGAVGAASAADEFVIADAVVIAATEDLQLTYGNRVLVAYNGSGGDVYVPQGVEHIDSFAFQGNQSITGVTIPEGALTIGAGAFQNCVNLTWVVIPASVTEIGSAAFQNCYNLTHVYVYGDLAVGEDIFDGCYSLTLHSGGGDIETQAHDRGLPILDIVTGQTRYFLPDGSPAAGLAYASTQAVEVDGVAVTFPCYALKDENGNDTNYVRIRDLALSLTGTRARFNVGWDGDVVITTLAHYEEDGSELTAVFQGDQPYQMGAGNTKIDGDVVPLAAILLTDDNGGGYTYYRLRDLGAALNFNVGWSAERGVFLETRKPYNADN